MIRISKLIFNLIFFFFDRFFFFILLYIFLFFFFILSILFFLFNFFFFCIHLFFLIFFFIYIYILVGICCAAAGYENRTLVIECIFIFNKLFTFNLSAILLVEFCDDHF